MNSIENSYSKKLAFVSGYFFILSLVAAYSLFQKVRDEFSYEPKAYIAVGLAIAVIALCIRGTLDLLANRNWAFWFFTLMNLNFLVISSLAIVKIGERGLFVFWNVCLTKSAESHFTLSKLSRAASSSLMKNY